MKRGQIQVSFGMIFSIILMVAFIATAIYIIYIFLGMQKNVETGMFIRDLQSGIREVWVEYGGIQNRVLEIRLDKKVEYVCFYNSTAGDNSGQFSEQLNQIKRRSIIHDNNLYFLPPESTDGYSVKIDYVNMSALSSNPYCIANDGKVRIILNKEMRENLVRIS